MTLDFTAMAQEEYERICKELPLESDDANDYRKHPERHSGNHPSDYETLTEAERAALRYWIRASIMGANKYERRSSYGLKHDFEREGFYITNGQFKGAMLLEGYIPRDIHELNWTFKIQKRTSRRVRGHGYYDLYNGSTDSYSIGEFDMQYARLLVQAGYLAKKD